ncbi:MAG: septation protein A [Candidatus Liberibacter ctenarytainae]|uniref:Inner membrane-spanning protein YciB n=1 Tax=Candidatus Liberibacter ctenarytainae TaxID=2020335 RepID=A0A937ABU7_9HYPH|nr:septation protein A [Candidatus Liberibacter ctenarytainae]
MSASKSNNGFIGSLLEFGPLILFWLCSAYGDRVLLRCPALSQFGGVFVISTAVFVVATAISLGLSWFLLRKIQALPLISGVFVLVFGGLTVWFNDETFIKIKPTIFYFLSFCILFIGNLFGKNFLSLLLSHIIQLDSVGWRKLTMRWAFLFLFLAILNELIWRNCSTETWMLFKVVGTFLICMVFIMAQYRLIDKHAIRSK